MSLLQKFFKTKKFVEEYIKNNGMEEAVKEFGINKLCKFKLLNQILGTNLYSYKDIVCNCNGIYLGHPTGVLHDLEYNKFLQTFDNGNIILYLPKEKALGTFGIFDKDGNQIVPYGRYYCSYILPKTVVLQNGDVRTGIKAIMMKRDGNIQEQDFTYIYLDDKLERINARPNGERICKACYPDREEIVCFSQQGEIIDLDLKTEETEKGID